MSTAEIKSPSTAGMTPGHFFAKELIRERNGSNDSSALPTPLIGTRLAYKPVAMLSASSSGLASFADPACRETCFKGSSK